MKFESVPSGFLLCSIEMIPASCSTFSCKQIWEKSSAQLSWVIHWPAHVWFSNSFTIKLFHECTSRVEFRAIETCTFVCKCDCSFWLQRTKEFYYGMKMQISLFDHQFWSLIDMWSDKFTAHRKYYSFSLNLNFVMKVSLKKFNQRLKENKKNPKEFSNRKAKTFCMNPHLSI